VATARLGLAVGIDEVVKTLQNIGIVRSISPYPSLTLGAVELAPVEIAQMYQTIASGGHLAPLRTIHWIGDAAARPLARYPLRPRPAIDPAVAYLLNYALQEVVRSGTGRALAGVFPAELQLAGKTGTTGGYRDSWFAGYAGNILAVVWVGRDDNKPINLTGAAGALRVWSDLMARLPLRPVRLYQPERIHKVRLAGIHKGMTDAGCAGIRPVPFIVGSEPATATLCDTAERSGLQQWLKRWWQGTSATPEHDDTLR
jgi:penicillin-binding protein 1B